MVSFFDKTLRAYITFASYKYLIIRQNVHQAMCGSRPCVLHYIYEMVW